MTEGLTQRAPPPLPGWLLITTIIVMIVILVIVVITTMAIMATSTRLALQQVEAEKHLVMVREKNTTQVTDIDSRSSKRNLS